MKEPLLSGIYIDSLTLVARHTLTKLHHEIRDRRATTLTYKPTGRTVYTSGGGTYISDRDHVILMTAGSDYSFDILEVGECIQIEFNTAQPLPRTGVECYAVKNPDVLVKLFYDCEREWTFKRACFAKLCLARTYEIMALLERGLEQSYLGAEKQRQLQRAIEYLEKNIDSPGLDTEALALSAGLSISYFRRLFTDFYSVSPGRYIQSIRVGRAKELLASGAVSVSEVAKNTGLANQYYFSSVFKKETGMSPSEYCARFR